MSESNGRFVLGEDEEPPRPDLRDMARQDAERRLTARLDRIKGRIAEDREKEDDEPLPPEIVQRLEALCAAHDAPLAYRSLARRVHEGRLTWEDYWRDPLKHGGDYRLIAAVVRDIASNPPTGESPAP